MKEIGYPARYWEGLLRAVLRVQLLTESNPGLSVARDARCVLFGYRCEACVCRFCGTVHCRKVAAVPFVAWLAVVFSGVFKGWAGVSIPARFVEARCHRSMPLKRAPPPRRAREGEKVCSRKGGLVGFPIRKRARFVFVGGVSSFPSSIQFCSQ